VLFHLPPNVDTLRTSGYVYSVALTCDALPEQVANPRQDDRSISAFSASKPKGPPRRRPNHIAQLPYYKIRIFAFALALDFALLRDEEITLSLFLTITVT
jgi:hypothetical protein